MAGAGGWEVPGSGTLVGQEMRGKRRVGLDPLPELRTLSAGDPAMHSPDSQVVSFPSAEAVFFLHCQSIGLELILPPP